MTPEKLRSWLRHKPAGATRVQIVQDGPTGVQVIADWERDELETLETPEQDVAQAMIEQAQDFCDMEGEACKFLVRWIGTRDRPLKVVTHRAKPRPEDEGGTVVDRSAISDATIIRDLLRHLETQQKHLASSLGTILDANRKTLDLMSAQQESMAKQLAELRASEQAPARDASPEEREESIQRAKALEALTAKLPEAIDLGIAAVANRFLAPAPPGEDSSAEH